MSNDKQETTQSSAVPLDKIVRCPCGNIPKNITITEGSCSKWALASGDCCGEWFVEFRTSYEEITSTKCMEYAVESWNKTKRSEFAYKDMAIKQAMDLFKAYEMVNWEEPTPRSHKDFMEIMQTALDT